MNEGRMCLLFPYRVGSNSIQISILFFKFNLREMAMVCTYQRQCAR
jgi:hypothetical protein